MKTGQIQHAPHRSRKEKATAALLRSQEPQPKPKPRLLQPWSASLAAEAVIAAFKESGHVL